MCIISVFCFIYLTVSFSLYGSKVCISIIWLYFPSRVFLSDWLADFFLGPTISNGPVNLCHLPAHLSTSGYMLLLYMTHLAQLDSYFYLLPGCTFGVRIAVYNFLWFCNQLFLVFKIYVIFYFMFRCIFAVKLSILLIFTNSLCFNNNFILIYIITVFKTEHAISFALI